MTTIKNYRDMNKWKVTKSSYRDKMNTKQQNMITETNQTQIHKMTTKRDKHYKDTIDHKETKKKKVQ